MTEIGDIEKTKKEEVEKDRNNSDRNGRINRKVTSFNTKVTIIGAVVAILCTAVAIYLSNPKVDPQYKKFIACAKEFIEKGEFEKARYYLNNAQKIDATDEVRNLLGIITEKQIKKMQKKFEELDQFCKGSASKEEKLKRCLVFLDTHKTIPQNDKTETMISQVKNFIAQLEKEISDDR